MASWEVFSVVVRLHLFIMINLLLLLLDMCFYLVINKELFYYYYYYYLYFGKFVTNYHKEPKSMTFFNELAFFHADINQSEVEDSFQLASDWIKSARKNVNKSKAVTLLDSLL